jgi:hypothetical protein
LSTMGGLVRVGATIAPDTGVVGVVDERRFTPVGVGDDRIDAEVAANGFVGVVVTAAVEALFSESS